MKLLYLRTGLLHVNSYFLINENTNECVLIDCGERYDIIKKTALENEFTIKAVLLTHAHFDHSGIAKKLQEEGAKIYISKIDASKLLDDGNLAYRFGRKFSYLTADYTFNDGEILEICGIKIKVILTAGHTDGSATFMVDNMLFTGDTLFNGCVGRTDFPTGDFNQMVNSVRKLFALSGDYLVYPGHDEFTTLDNERKHNEMAEYD